MTEELEPLDIIDEVDQGPNLMPWFDEVYSLDSYQRILECGYVEVPLSEQKRKQSDTLRLRPWNLKLGDAGYYEIVTTRQGVRGEKVMKVRAKLRERFTRNAAGYLVPDPNSRGLCRASRLIVTLDEYDALLKMVHQHILRLKLVVPRPEPTNEHSLTRKIDS